MEAQAHADARQWAHDGGAGAAVPAFRAQASRRRRLCCGCCLFDGLYSSSTRVAVVRSSRFGRRCDRNNQRFFRLVPASSSSSRASQLDANVPTLAAFNKKHKRRRGDAWTKSKKLSSAALAAASSPVSAGASGGGDVELGAGGGGDGGGAKPKLKSAAAADEAADEELDEELEQPWMQPSVKYARVWEALNHPRDKHNEKFAWWGSTTGRHCVYGGCGAQLDLGARQFLLSG